jgi:hypothetical protein
MPLTAKSLKETMEFCARSYWQENVMPRLHMAIFWNRILHPKEYRLLRKHQAAHEGMVTMIRIMNTACLVDKTTEQWEKGKHK